MRQFTFVILIYMSMVGSLLADDALPLRAQHRQQQLLVLNSGRVVSGRLTPRTGGYDITLPAGRMFVGSEQIRFKAANMEDAYLRMRGSVNQLTPNVHIQLAKWCLANNLPTNARRELLDALHLDPYRDEAKRMLAGIVREKSRAQVSTSKKKAVDLGDRLMPERRSLGGLPAPLAKEFTRVIQPLVSNRCGNARCHGPGRREFAVVSIKSGSTPYIAEQNLAAILNQIDYAEPDNSPLLRASLGSHGGSRKLLFSGQVGNQQREVLRKWINNVASELAPTVRVAAARPKQKTIVQTAATKESSAGFHGAKKTHAQTDPKFMTEAESATRHDDFDPGVFNRRFRNAAASNKK